MKLLAKITIWLLALVLMPLPDAGSSAAMRPEVSFRKVGLASWYSEFSPGIRDTTANMERFDDSGLTCAMWDIDFNSIVKVTNLENGKSIYVRVNDRGPAKRLVEKGRIIDLTMGAFSRIADLEKGLARVKVEIVL